MAKNITWVIFLCCVLGQSYAARRVFVEDVIAETRMRFADEFKKRADDGDPPGLEDLLDLPKEEDLKPITSIVTVDNVQKTKFEQKYENIPVYGSHITAADDEKTGKPTEEVTGVMIKGIEEDISDTKPKITKEEALKIAKKYHNHEKVVKESMKLEVHYKDDKAYLAYKVKYLTSANGEKTAPITIVDAKEKEVIDTWESLTTAHRLMQGYGGNTHIGRINFTGEAGQLGRLNLTEDPNDNTRCLMKNDYFRVINLDGRNFVDWPTMWRFIRQARNIPTIAVDCNVDPIPNNELRDAYNVINDVYYFTYHSFKMYERFNLTAYNRAIDIWVNFTEDRGGNAAAFSNLIFVNDGGRRFYPLSSYADVLAHELGHSFTSINSNLEYRNQSGGMNEAFSDMSGETFDNYLYGQNNWIIGESVYRDPRRGRGLRYMNNPPNDRVSIDHFRNFNDAMDPHFSSGVYNKAFHDLTNTAGWDINRAFEVFSLANRLYWGVQTTMHEGACGVLDAARDRGYSQNDVTQAFAGVGVRCNRPNPVVVNP